MVLEPTACFTARSLSSVRVRVSSEKLPPSHLHEAPSLVCRVGFVAMQSGDLLPNRNVMESQLAAP